MVLKCNQLVVRDDLTCASCERPVAQYPSKVPSPDGSRPLVWEHRRGAVVGQAAQLRSALSVAEARAERAETQLAEVTLLVGDAQRLDRIERLLEALLRGKVEWKPEHRRHVDGGATVRRQRSDAGMPRRRIRDPERAAG